MPHAPLQMAISSTATEPATCAGNWHGDDSSIHATPLGRRALQIVGVTASGPCNLNDDAWNGRNLPAANPDFTTIICHRPGNKFGMRTALYTLSKRTSYGQISS